MRSSTFILFLTAAVASASPQGSLLGKSKGKTTGPKPSGGKAAGGGGFMASLAGMMGLDPKGDIPSMVCESFKPGSSTGKLIGGMFGSPNGNGPDEQCMKDDSGGSGQWKANYTGEPTLPAHTIYAPIDPPKDQKLPVIIWGNGFCLPAGTMFMNFLREIASHGYVIIANGEPVGAQLGSQTTYKDLIKSIDWVMTNPAAKKYGQLDTSKLLVSGQSCGGLEALEATIADPRIKMTALFNSGYLQGSTKTSMAKFKTPLAYFLGGAKDIAQKNGLQDYKNLPDNVPGLIADIEVGHIGTYYQKGGGKMGKAAVAFLDWQLKGDASKKALFCAPAAESELVKAGFKMQSKNGFC